MLLLVPDGDARARHLGARLALEVEVAALPLATAGGRRPVQPHRRAHRLDGSQPLVGRHLQLEVDVGVEAKLDSDTTFGIDVGIELGFELELRLGYLGSRLGSLWGPLKRSLWVLS